MCKLWRHICRAKRLDSTCRLAGVEHKLCESDGRHAVARVVVDKSGAHGPRACRLSVPHEHPRGRKQKLSLVSVHGLVVLWFSGLVVLWFRGAVVAQLLNYPTT